MGRERSLKLTKTNSRITLVSDKDESSDGEMRGGQVAIQWPISGPGNQPGEKVTQGSR